MATMFELPCCFTQMLWPCPPFHFDGTVWKASYFPSSDVHYETGHLWQSLRWKGQYYGIHLENQGTIEAPCIRLEIYSAQPLGDPENGDTAADVSDAIAAEIGWRFDLYSDLRSFYDGYANDEILGPVLARWRGVRSSGSNSLYEFLVITTVLQNATVRRTVQMFENLFERFGNRLAFGGRVLSGFWDPAAIHAASDDELRALKVGYRAKTFKRQAAAFVEGGLDEHQLRLLPTPQLRRALLSIYGVGPASVWYLLFGHFKRLDAFETVSPWETKIYARLLFGRAEASPAEILAEVEQRWGASGCKMLAAHLLFEDLFWQHRQQPIPWLAEQIRL